MKATVLSALIAILITPLICSAEQINDFEQSNGQQGNNDQVTVPVLFIVVTGPEDWQTFLRDQVGPAMKASGKAEIAPFNTYLDWANAAGDYARTSGRYRQDTVPPFGQYIAPTHEMALSFTLNWKTVRVTHDASRFFDFDDRGVDICVTTLTVEITAQVYSLTNALMSWTFKGKGEASVQYVGVDNWSASLQDDVMVRATAKAAKSLADKANFTITASHHK
ncbi:MAG: hypothetical protein Q7S37_03905 [bacterium]|nr:hypothetical protein [bacterium]